MTMRRNIIWVNPDLVVGNQPNGCFRNAVFFRQIRMKVNVANFSDFLHFLPRKAIATIVALLFWCRPSTIRRFVIPVCVNAVQSQALGVPVRHRPFFKRQIPFPFLTISNAATAVIFMAVFATVFHPLPYFVKTGMGVPVFSMGVDRKTTDTIRRFVFLISSPMNDSKTTLAVVSVIRFRAHTDYPSFCLTECTGIVWEKQAYGSGFLTEDDV